MKDQARQRRLGLPLHVRDGMALIVAFGALFGLVSWLIKLYRNAQVVAMQTECENRLKQIGLGLYNYHSVWNCFPPAVTTDASGRPMHSWRTLVAPFAESSKWYPQYHMDEPWNGPNNGLLVTGFERLYSCPLDPRGVRTGRTSYLAVTGPGTCFPGPNQSATLDDVTKNRNGPLFLVVETTARNIHWMQPGDLDVSEIRPRPNEPTQVSISSQHSGANVLRTDFWVTRLRDSIPVEEMRQALPLAGRSQGIDPLPKRP